MRKARDVWPFLCSTGGQDGCLEREDEVFGHFYGWNQGLFAIKSLHLQKTDRQRSLYYGHKGNFVTSGAGRDDGTVQGHPQQV